MLYLNFSNCRVIHLENGLTALLVSDTHSVTQRKHHDSDMSTTDDEDGCSEDLDEESDDDEDGNSDDEIDGVMGEDPDGDQENDFERSRKAKDTKLVSFCRQMIILKACRNEIDVHVQGAEQHVTECKLPHKLNENSALK